MKYIKNLSKKQILVGVIVVILILFAVYNGIKKDSPTADFVVAKRSVVVQEINVTGRVKPAESVELAFEKTGKIAWVSASVGGRVHAGLALAGLENKGISSELAQATANVSIQKALLDELIRGSRPEEIRVQELKVENARTLLEDAKRNLTNKLNDSFTKSDDAVRNKVDQFFTNPRSANPEINISVPNSQLKTSIELGRVSVEGALTAWQPELANLLTTSDLAVYTATAKTRLDLVRSFLDNAALAVNSTSANVDLKQTTLDGYKIDVASARTNVNAAISNLSDAEEKLKNAESSLALAEQGLTLLHAGTASEQITAQEARVKEAEAQVSNKEAELAKTIMRAPFDGVVTEQDAKVGEIVAANAIVMALISDAEFEIEANIPEIDIAKLSIGDHARVTLDAYGSDELFDAVVVSIEPAGTIIDGVPTYKTALQFSKRDERVRSGMTANIDIETAKRSNVIAVPSRAVVARQGKKIVRILVRGATEEREVETGLRGSDGMVEIMSGIEEGDTVITFLEE